ncbi:MAG: BamA/TamA family outer membrane protein [Gammaproteobacteria bacterium]|nr:BamA/TamA family outer membrane protein [Gammaproteobacteria bacterium]
MIAARTPLRLNLSRIRSARLRRTGARTVRVGCLLAMLVGLAASAWGADPLPYRVSFASTGSDSLDDTLAATSDLESLRGGAPVGPFGLIVRARSDIGRLKTVLESFGYYESAVAITVDGRPLADPALAEALTALPKGRDARVSVAFSLGPLYRIGRISVDGDPPPFALRALGLAGGQPAVAAAVLAGGARMQGALQEQGYAFAKVAPPVATEDPTRPLLDLRFKVVAGPKVDIGTIRIVGLAHLREAYLRRRLQLRVGEPYAPSTIERARRDLLDLGVFSAVSIRTADAPEAGNRLPLTLDLRERPRHSVAVDAAYSSDLGGSGGVTWTNRDAFGHAERLSLSSSVTDIGGTAATSLGYDVGAKLVLPDFARRDQSLQISLDAAKQSLQAYDQTALTTGVTLIRRLSSVWSATAGVTTANETIIQPPGTATPRAYTLVATPIGLSYDSTNLSSPLEDALHGMRDSITVAPTRSIGRPNATFVVTQVKLAAYLDLHRFGWSDRGRSVLAGRVLAGFAQGAGEYSLPPDQRFYGGGSGTIRGFRYQGVGPQFPCTPPATTCAEVPIGGTAIVAASLEFRQRFGRKFGAALFVDAGQVSASLKPLPNVLRVGLGAGLRYYTPIGPIRFDVAVPRRHYQAGDDYYEIYVGLGQAF